ncbi:mitochondrial 54S ribosomal protein YmL33 [Tricharina praecox]|uniref:mitochondrial 54S ribosomal protein YmL33 n=1 Tax=Tricharina praecox TaxID=43433 RepID=UPI00221EB4D6|nr:mitochondrial 54S ribosomal protein YmL33 [Tricharina praecox]KAI5858466.1 mitochondrial 54S ribosomal protein YmL33 [Tricharina praecox]
MSQPTMYFKIILLRSGIGMTKRQNGVLASLGLRKRMSIVYHPVSQEVAGKIMKVKELLAVSECPFAETKAEIHVRRQPPSGFIVEA